MEQNKLNEELNQLLKGTHMGASIFEDLRDKLKSEKLKEEFHGILEKLRLHERSLTSLIMVNDGDAVDSAGIMGTITDMMYSLKNMLITEDKQVLEEAVKCMATAQKALHDFQSRHKILSDNIKKTIHIMQDDYGAIYHTLHKYLIEF